MFLSCLFLCYLLFPFIKENLRKINKSSKIVITYILIFITIFSPFVVRMYNVSSIYPSPFFRLLEFIIGMIIADYVINYNKENKKNFSIFFILIEILFLIFSVTTLSKRTFFAGDYTIYNFISVPVFFALIYHSAFIENKVILKICKSSFIQYLSNISFSFFLGQFFCFRITRSLLSSPLFSVHKNFKMIFVPLIINLLLAIILYELIEKPFRKMLNKIMLDKKTEEKM